MARKLFSDISWFLGCPDMNLEQKRKVTGKNHLHLLTWYNHCSSLRYQSSKKEEAVTSFEECKKRPRLMTDRRLWFEAPHARQFGRCRVASLNCRLLLIPVVHKNAPSSPCHHRVLSGDGDPGRLEHALAKLGREAQAVHHEVSRQAELLAHQVGRRPAVVHLLVL